MDRYGIQECFTAHKLKKAEKGTTGKSETTEANQKEPISGTTVAPVLLGVLLLCLTALLATLLVYTYRRRRAVSVVQR